MVPAVEGSCSLWEKALALGIFITVLLFNAWFISNIPISSTSGNRARVLTESVEQLIEKSEFDDNSGSIKGILNAAHNQWFINLLFKEEETKNTYFKLQPHFNQGVSYTTQISDLVVPRYVIAEHSEWVIIYLVVSWLFVVALVYYGRRYTITASNRVLGEVLCGIPLFLFTQSYIVCLRIFEILQIGTLEYHTFRRF